MATFKWTVHPVLATNKEKPSTSGTCADAVVKTIGGQVSDFTNLEVA